MRVHRGQLGKAYEFIRNESLKQGCTVLILAAPDPDSLCACRIITSLLRVDNIQYQILPVAGFQGLTKACEELVKGSFDVRSVLLVNCGAVIDLLGTLQLEEHTAVYVLDSHRPYHLRNVREENEQIRVLDDGDESVEFPADVSDGEAVEGAEGEGEDEEEEEEGDDAGEDEGEGDGEDEKGEAEEEEEDAARGRAEEVEEEEEEESKSPRARRGGESETGRLSSREDSMDLLLRGEENDGGDMVASSRRESAETQADDDEEEEEEEAEAAEAGKEDEEEEQAEEGAGEAAEEGDDAATTALTAAARRPRARRRARDWEAMGERVLQRRRVEQPSLPELRARNEQRRKLREYYSTSSYATSVACLAYEMAAQLDREHPDLLWCAIVGLTDQLVHERIERSAYASQASTFVQRVSSLESARRARPSSIRAAAAAMAAAAAAAGAADADQLVQVARNGEMSVQTDVRFMLFRHWTLYDSMYFSHYVATKFQIWTQPGKQRLEYLLAKMGIPLAESRQQYRFMTAAHKSALGAQLKLYAPKFHLQDVFFGSFTRQLGGMLVSAADVVYALTALLESPQTRGASPSSARQPGDGPAAAARAVATPTAAAAATANAEGGVEAEAEAEAGPEAHEWDDRFWAAEEALASGNATLLRAGIQEAIRLQVAIVRQAESILQNKALVSAGPFRYAIVEDPVDDAAFVQPLTLSRLALFIVDAMREKKKKKPKPMVLAVQSRASSTYTVIGLAEKAFDGHVGRNSFGIAFREAAEHTRARIRHDGFDASIIEVLRDDVRHFVEYLHSGLCESLRI